MVIRLPLTRMMPLRCILLSVRLRVSAIVPNRPARVAFVLLDCNLAGGRLVADRLDGLLDPLREEAGLGFSMGVAVYDREMIRSEQLVAAAESALRTAQAQGGNQIEFHG